MNPVESTYTSLISGFLLNKREEWNMSEGDPITGTPADTVLFLYSA